MTMKSKINWAKVDWSMSNEEIAQLCRCAASTVAKKRWSLFGASRNVRRGTFGVRMNLTPELNTAIRRAAGRANLSFSEWMRRAAEMKLESEEACHG